MTRVLAVLAALLWAAGMVVLIVVLRQLSPGIEGAYFTRDVGAPAYSGVYSYDAGGTIDLLAVATGLLGVAGLVVGGLVLRARRG